MKVDVKRLRRDIESARFRSVDAHGMVSVHGGELAALLDELELLCLVRDRALELLEQHRRGQVGTDELAQDLGVVLSPWVIAPPTEEGA